MQLNGDSEFEALIDPTGWDSANDRDRGAMNQIWLLLCLPLLAVFGAAKLHSQATESHLHTTVQPLAGEDLEHSCEYDMMLPPSAKRIRAVWIIFERGQDIQRLYDDPGVRSFAAQNRFAIMMSHHCRSKSYEDIDVDPNRGIGRALFAAVDQLANQSGHVELKTAPIILLGFSGAGSLTGRLVAYAPKRIAAAILANAGQFEPLGLDTIQLPAESLAVPELILVGGTDDHVGTERAYDYFSKYHAQGAPWLFLVQNNVPHCCVVNAKEIMLNWLREVLKVRLANSKRGLAPMDRTHGYEGFIQLTATGVRDNWRLPTSNVSRACFLSTGEHPPSGEADAGWLPSKNLAKEWLEFTLKKTHPVISMP